MPQIPIIMPQLGESIAEATIVNLLVRTGDQVQADQDIIEVETNKALMTVTAPCAGIIKHFAVTTGDSYPVGAILGQLEVTDTEAARLGLTSSPSGMVTRPDDAHPSDDTGHAPLTPKKQAVEPTVRGLPVPAHAAGAAYMSPRMKARMTELGLHSADLSGIAGSGAGGRVTIQDFEKFITNIEKHKHRPASSMRVAVADAMRRSWTRPLATVGLPVRIDAMLAHRKQQNPKPGPTLYALRALALALAQDSGVAGRLIGNQIVHPGAIDIGFAVEAEDGVLVPVIRNAETKPLADLVAIYNNLLDLARQRRLTPDATGNSIATITNYGTFGLTWATPIPLPEQTLVLGLGAGRKVPAWNDSTNQFEPATEANLTLSFDHRVLDGGAAGRLLTKIADLMTNPASL
jgi:pyruvate/2-oxoglutarate dehydrogenase complex dihydrolipoamide acyltransferase (E2) component